MTSRDAKIRVSVKTVPHSNPAEARSLLAGLLLNQYLDAEEEKSRAAEELQSSTNAFDLLHEKARQLDLDPTALDAEIATLKAQFE